jgi:tetratricopeptide (TPR) repeat protein
VKRAISVCLVAVAAVAASTATAHAQPAPPAPRPEPAPARSLPAPDTSKIEALFVEGTKHYDLGEWDAAIARFKQAYALMPDPSFLFNLGQSYRQKNSCREATAAYKSYLRHAPDEDRAKVEQFLRELEPCVKAEEERARRLAPPPRLSSRHVKLRWAGLATGAVGALLAGGGVFFTVKAINTENDAEARCRTLCNGADLVALEREGKQADRNAKLLYAVGGAAVAAGATLFLYTVLRADYVTVEPTPGGAIVGALARFR